MTPAKCGELEGLRYHHYVGEKTTAGTDEFELCLVRCRDTGSHSRVYNQMRPPETTAFKESSKRVVNTVRAKRKTCKFFEKLDAILGHRPPSAPSVLLMPDPVTDEPSSHNGVEGDGDGKQCIVIIVSYLHSTIVVHLDTDDMMVLSSVDSTLASPKPTVLETKDGDNGRNIIT